VLLELSDPDPEVSFGAAEEMGRQHGCWAEAVAELDDRRRLQLCVMAARAGARAWQPGWVLREIADLAELTDDAGREVLREAATSIAESSFPIEAVQAHLEGVRGWARIADRLPSPGDTDGDVGQRTWRLVDELIFGLERGHPAAEHDADRCWQELHGPCASAAVDVLSMVQQASAIGSSIHRTSQPYDQLVEAYPGQIRALLQWGLPNRGRLVSTMQLPARELAGYMIGELGRLGDTGTVALLHAYLPDPELGPAAVKAIRTIERRLAGTT